MRVTLTFILFCWQLVATAQPGGKQVLPPDSVQAPTLFNYYSNLYQYYEQAPGQVLFHPSAKYGFSSGSYSVANGDWRTFQMPEHSQRYEIASRGAMQLNKVKLMGEFNYQRTLDDSVGWMLKPDQSDRSPYYLANQKPGNWDTHRYQLKGTGAIPIAGPLYLVAGAALNLGNYGRFTDPRPSISRHRLQLNAGIGYTSGGFGVALSGIYGYGEENTKVAYANTMNNTPGRPTYVTHDIMGYGYSRTSGAAGLKLNEDQQTKGFTAVVQASKLNLAYTFTQTERNYFREEVLNQTTAIGDVFGDSHTALASYTFDTQKASNLLALEVTYEQLVDFNHVIFNGNNFSGTLLSVKPAYFAKRGDWEYSLAADLARDNRKDGTVAVNYLTQTAALQLGGGKLFNLKNGYLKVDTRVAYRTDLGSELTIGSQLNEFMKGVVLPDFAFYSAGQLSQATSVGYGFKVKGVVLMPALTYELQKPLNSPASSDAIFTPANLRSTYGFGLNIHM